MVSAIKRFRRSSRSARCLVASARSKQGVEVGMAEDRLSREGKKRKSNAETQSAQRNRRAEGVKSGTPRKANPTTALQHGGEWVVRGVCSDGEFVRVENSELKGTECRQGL